MEKKILLFISIAIPLAAGACSALLSGGSMAYGMLNKPFLSPPGWLFPVVWTILYILMGIAAYLVMVSGREQGIRRALFVYDIQLAVNFFWSVFFFRFGWYFFSFLWLVLLLVLILITILRFYKVSKTAAYLLIPYLVWVTFAGYLNLSIYFLNLN